MKKRLSIFIILTVLFLSSTLLLGCVNPFTISGEIPAAEEEFLGRWNLTRSEWRSATDSGSRTPGHGMWTETYFIEFRENGIFRELNFWHHAITLNGSFEYENGIIELALFLDPHTGEPPITGLRSFAPTRNIRLKNENLILTYSRASRHYRHTFIRA